MSDVKISEARDQLAELADRAHYEHARFTLTKGGRPWAVLISAEDAELLRALEDAVDRRLAEVEGVPTLPRSSSAPALRSSCPRLCAASPSSGTRL